MKMIPRNIIALIHLINIFIVLIFSTLIVYSRFHFVPKLCTNTETFARAYVEVNNGCLSDTCRGFDAVSKTRKYTYLLIFIFSICSKEFKFYVLPAVSHDIILGYNKKNLVWCSKHSVPTNCFGVICSQM